VPKRKFGIFLVLGEVKKKQREREKKREEEKRKKKRKGTRGEQKIRLIHNAPEVGR